MSFSRVLVALGWVLSLVVSLVQLEIVRADDASASTAELICSRGYLATSDGYTLHLVRATKLLIERGDEQAAPSLHGLFTSSKMFVIYSTGAKVSRPVSYAVGPSLESNQI